MHTLAPALPVRDALAGSPDIFALEDRLHALFSRYGQVQRLDMVRADQGRTRRVLCFLRMGSAEQEQAVVQDLGMGRFGGDLVMVVALDGAPLAPPTGRPGLSAALGSRPAKRPV